MYKCAALDWLQKIPRIDIQAIRNRKQVNVFFFRLRIVAVFYHNKLDTLSHFRKSNAMVYGQFNLSRRKNNSNAILTRTKSDATLGNTAEKSCRQQNIPKRTMKSNEGALRPRMAAALLLVLFREIWGWDHNPKQLNNQQRG